MTDSDASRRDSSGSGARFPHVDNLRTTLVAWVIGGHALLGYTAVGGWPYDEIHEITFAPVNELVLVAVLGPSGLFVIGLFFFISGLLTERAVAHHGPTPYIRDRLLRLGLPWLASALVIWPLSLWLAYRAAGRQVSPWWVFTHRDPFLDAGSLWFALVLLIYSVAFALWRRGRPPPPGPVRPLTGVGLLLAVVAIAVVSFVVRLWFPARSGQIADLHLWQWPQCLGMFALGVVAARRGWTRRVPERIRRACGVATVATLVLLPPLALASGVRDVAHDVTSYLGGRHWQALATASVEGILVVAGSVWLLGLAERRLNGSGARSTRWAHSAFAAFVLQGPILLGLASAGRLFDAPAEVKGPLVAASSIVVCFWVGRHVPFLGSSSWPGRPHHHDPAQVENAVPVHYVDFGGTPHGPTIVLVHGIGGCHLNWDLLGPLLIEHGRVVAVDLPGFGRSAPSGRPATVASNVDALARFIRDVSPADPVLVCGNSMGALIAVLLAARTPQMVGGLVLLDPALPAPGHVLRSPATSILLALHGLPGVGEWLRGSRRRRIGTRATVLATLRDGGVDPAALPPDLLERSTELAESQSLGTDRAFLSAARSLAWTLARPGAYRRAMSSITVPVLLVHGDRDRLVPVTAARRTARQHPGWQYVELAGGGHLPHLQLPGEVAQLIAGWLAGLPVPR